MNQKIHQKIQMAVWLSAALLLFIDCSVLDAQSERNSGHRRVSAITNGFTKIVSYLPSHHDHTNRQMAVVDEVPEIQYGLNAGFPQFGQVTHGVWYNGPKHGPGQNADACGKGGCRKSLCRANCRAKCRARSLRNSQNSVAIRESYQPVVPEYGNDWMQFEQGDRAYWNSVEPPAPYGSPQQTPEVYPDSPTKNK